MPDDIQILIDSLRRGQYDDPTEKIGLLSAALLEQRTEVVFLLNLLRAPQTPLRLAAIGACRDRSEPEIVSALVLLASDSEVRVRLKLAEILRFHAEPDVIPALHKLLKDEDEDVRQAALKSTAGRAEFRHAHQDLLANDNDWNVRLLAANAMESLSSPAIIKSLFEALLRDSDDDVRRRCGEIIDKRLESDPGGTEAHLPVDVASLSRAEKALKYLGAHRFGRLTPWIAARTTVTPDLELLGRFGTDLTALALNGTLGRAHFSTETRDTIRKLVQREPWRSIALLGPAGVGKTALVHELVHELAQPENGGWRVLRVSPADFMAGTKYLGEWETKVENLVEAIKKPRRVILYVPNLSDLSAAGTWSKSDSSVARALAPFLGDGSVLLIGESTPEEFERGLGAQPSLARLFDKVLLHEPSLEETREILSAVRDAEKSSVSDEFLGRLMELSRQFLSHISRPGNAVELLKSAIKLENGAGRTPVFRDILDLLSKSTGLPVDLLDDNVPLDAAALRTFFEKRIIGQPEAVDAMVDLVTLIKAGVTDPNKPYGVFLFVGPTGVGKTELARALAEFIFGDAARLKRFDMSEFASADGFTRLIGGNSENGLLTDAVRQQPFSVVLLDEIEKAHVNVFDLCLQLFDAGRLTDGRGRTIDFRRTIVILTSNIGATAGSTPLGFVFSAETGEVADPDKDRTFRELSRFFRPEFLNRLDRIIPFRSLSLQVAEQIARREVDLVLQRSGIRRRQLVVEIDAGVVALLVREGYSPHFGARPLKRTVERLLLLPLARAISSGSIRDQTVLRLKEEAGRVEATVVSKPVPRKVSTTSQPASWRTRLSELQGTYAELERAVQPFVDRKSELIAQTQLPDFARDAAGRIATLGEIHQLDQFLSLHQSVGKILTAVEERVERTGVSKLETPALLEKLERIGGEIAHLKFVTRCQDALDLGDALLTISLVNRTGAVQDAVPRLAAMYQAFVVRRRFSAEILGEFYEESRDRVYLLTSGLGAYALLKQETGFHQVDRRFKESSPRSGREVIREDRELLRVQVSPAGLEPPRQLRQRIKSKVSTLKPIRERLLKAEFDVSLFDEESLHSVEIWTPGPKADALERALTILNAQSREAPKASAPDSIIRHYDVGISPKVRDTRTGRSTTRIDRVMKGDLDSFFEAESSGT